MKGRRGRGDRFEVTVTAIGGRGDGIAETPRGRAFIPFTVAGDRARIRLAGARGDGFAARVVEMLAPGPGRTPPACRHFGECGGCALQHLDDDGYAAWKRDQVIAALGRRGLTPDVAPLRRTQPGGRRRARFVAARGVAGVVLGFRAGASHRVVDMAACPVLRPALVALLPPLRALLGALLRPGDRAEVSVTAAAEGLDVVVAAPIAATAAVHARLAAFADDHDLARLSVQPRGGDALDLIARRRPVRTILGGVAVDLPPRAFLQADATAEAAMVDAVMAAAAASDGEAGDLYAGCGTFALALAHRFRVHAVEVDGDMAAALEAAARRAALPVTVETRDLGRRPLLAEEMKRFAMVVFDPPRAGAAAQAAALARSAVPLVVAISCDPATFARDARILTDGGYRLESVTPIDQFLWSPRIELVAALRR